MLEWEKNVWVGGLMLEGDFGLVVEWRCLEVGVVEVS